MDGQEIGNTTSINSSSLSRWLYLPAIWYAVSALLIFIIYYASSSSGTRSAVFGSVAFVLALAAYAVVTLGFTLFGLYKQLRYLYDYFPYKYLSISYLSLAMIGVPLLGVFLGHLTGYTSYGTGMGLVDAFWWFVIALIPALLTTIAVVSLGIAVFIAFGNLAPIRKIGKFLYYFVWAITVLVGLVEAFFIHALHDESAE